MTELKVRQMTSNSSGWTNYATWRNQFVIYTDEGTYFHEHMTAVIAFRDNNRRRLYT